MSKRLGWFFAIVATIAYSTNAPIARGVILAGMSPVTLLSGRFLLAVLLYSVTLSVLPVRNASGGRPLDRFGFWVGVGSGMINGFMMTAFFTVLETVSASIASMSSVALIQLFTLGLLFLRGEPITLRHSLRWLVGMAGLYMVIGLGGSADAFGLLLLVISSILYSIHMVSVQWFLKPYNTWTITSLLVISATIAIIIVWVVTGAETYVPAPTGWIAILFLGVFATYIGRILTYSAISRIGSGQFVLLTPLETSLTILWSVIFLGERLTTLQWLGTFFILMSILLAADAVWRFGQRIFFPKLLLTEGGYGTYDDRR